MTQKVIKEDLVAVNNPEGGIMLNMDSADKKMLPIHG